VNVIAREAREPAHIGTGEVAPIVRRTLDRAEPRRRQDPFGGRAIGRTIRFDEHRTVGLIGELQIDTGTDRQDHEARLARQESP